MKPYTPALDRRVELLQKQPTIILPFFTEIKSTIWGGKSAGNEVMNRNEMGLGWRSVNKRNQGQFLAQGAADRRSHGRVGEGIRQAGHLPNLYYSVAIAADWAPDWERGLAPKHADFAPSASSLALVD